MNESFPYRRLPKKAWEINRVGPEIFVVGIFQKKD
jgi:hypothetical protein